MAQRAAREVHHGDRIYLDADFAENVRSFLPQNGYAMSDTSRPVNIAFLSTTKVCSGANHLESPLHNNRMRREWSRIPVRGTGYTLILIQVRSPKSEHALSSRCVSRANRFTPTDFLQR